MLETVAGLVPAVKPQVAFFEQYGTAGMLAFDDTIRAARQRGLLVIADAKRNDISSTAEAYAAAFLGEADVFGHPQKAFDADSMTVTPYLGRDSLLPFVEACAKHNKGLFIVLKTSNPGSRDFQDLELRTTGRPLYEKIAEAIREFGEPLMGEFGYSSIGAVIGATFPEDAWRLRALLPHVFILVTGYGSQGACGRDAAVCFNSDGMGAIVSSSRGITYSYTNDEVTKQSFVRCVRENTMRMIDDVNGALKR